MDIVATRPSALSDFQFKLHIIPLHPQTPEMPSQLSLFYATSLEISQIARWCRASPEHTLRCAPDHHHRGSPLDSVLSDLPVVSDPKDFTLKDDGMALCVSRFLFSSLTRALKSRQVYDDTMKVWSTVQGWVPQWGEVGQRVAEAIKRNPTIQATWDDNINHLNMGYESLKNFREDMWVNDNGSVRPVSSPLMLANTLDEEVKRV